VLVAVGAPACSDKEAPCSIDTDCAVGAICREGLCAAPVSTTDGGVLDGGPVACASLGTACSLDEECCTRICAGSRCASSGTSGTSGTAGRPGGSSGTTSGGTSGTSSSGGSTSSGGSCSDLYGICASDFDCCAPLGCTSGVCR